MSYKIFGAGFALALLAFSVPALAQTAPALATVVSACGTPPSTYTAGQNRPQTQDTTGKACGAATSTPVSTTPAQTTGTASSKVLCAAACTLYAANVTITTTSGYLLIHNLTADPGNGAVTPLTCIPVKSDGTNGALSIAWPVGKVFSTGATAVFSSTGCFTETLATAAFFSGDSK